MKQLGALLAVTLMASTAFAQTALDEEATRAARKRAEQELLEPEPPPPIIDEAFDKPVPQLPKANADKGKKKQPEPAPAAARAAEPAEVERDKKPTALVVTKIDDGDLTALWEAFRVANLGSDVSAEQKARSALLRIRSALGSPDMEHWSMGLIRAAKGHADKGDVGGAVEIAESAVQMAPHLAPAWSGLAEIYFQTDPTSVARSGHSLAMALKWSVLDRRYQRALVANIASVLGMAWAILSIVYFLVMLLRRGRYFLYDFHFLFPRAIARWQSALLAYIVLVAPVVFRAGLVPWLLVLFLALTLYLSLAERVVGAVLIAGVTALPLISEWVTHRTAFSQTPAEPLSLLEQAEPGSERIAKQFLTLVQENKATFEQTFALGTFELRRGNLESAVTHLKAALALRSEDPSARHNLGVALLLQGDLENPRALFTAVLHSNPNSAATHWNMARLLQRRYETYGEQAAGDVDRARESFLKAQALDPDLPTSTEVPKEGGAANSLLRLVNLPAETLFAFAKSNEAPKRVRAQLSLMLLGDVSEPFAYLYPVFVSAALVAFGSLSRRLAAARPCSRCASAVSIRGAPELSVGSQLCSQCVNVFTKRNAVLASAKVRKQLEIARYEAARDRTTSLLGVVFSGVGHLFAGSPVRGTAFAFCFLVAAVGFFFRNGSLRANFDVLPLPIRMAPLVLLFLVAFPLSLRSLKKVRASL